MDLQERNKCCLQQYLSKVQWLEGHTDDIFSYAFNYEGDTIITRSKDKTCRIWGDETMCPKDVLDGNQDWKTYWYEKWHDKNLKNEEGGSSTYI